MPRKPLEATAAGINTLGSKVLGCFYPAPLPRGERGSLRAAPSWFFNKFLFIAFRACFLGSASRLRVYECIGYGQPRKKRVVRVDKPCTSLKQSLWITIRLLPTGFRLAHNLPTLAHSGSYSSKVCPTGKISFLYFFKTLKPFSFVLRFWGSKCPL